MPNADANVEPGIAVDEVVASAAFECVVAVTADQDVAARPSHHRFGIDAFGNGRDDAAAKQIAHPVDSSDTGVGELMAPHVASSDARRGGRKSVWTSRSRWSPSHHNKKLSNIPTS